ncbi:MAG: tRNA (N(6)-L-threonylcarbamoyladenosine(37)-C(2))-methylthiotransferase [Methanoregula sp.]|nr:MAG: tRNA (N(6)-L-threonylcarbamoyladenosine(37)-C(2))-methylthiotransferase [Methanoregula sp.]
MVISDFLHLVGKRVYIETYGCRYNFGDTSKLQGILKYQGCTLVQSDEDAEAVIINTCTVVAATERRMLRRMSRFRDHDLYVTGCMSVVQREAILAVCTPKFISPGSVHEKYCSLGTVSSCPSGIIQIAQGCFGHCSYCIARVARGPLKSFPEQEILERIRASVTSGAAEIQLTAQDVSAYGQDTGTSLAQLLNGIDEVPGTYFVRVGMMNPVSVIKILDDLIDAFAIKKIFRFIHVPVQSGSDRILEGMGREYTCEDFEFIIAAFRKKYPEITVATDMIVGFPGETEEDFLKSLELLDRVRPDKVNVTRFSKRPHTCDFSVKEVPESIKKARSRIMNARSEQIYHTKNGAFIGRAVPFIVTERIRTGSVMARTPSYVGVVLNEDLPIGFTGHAVIGKEHTYFFSGEYRVDRTGDR